MTIETTETIEPVRSMRLPLLGTPRQIAYAEDIRRQWHEAFPQVALPDVPWAKFWIETRHETLDGLIERAVSEAEAHHYDPFTLRYPRWGRAEAVATLADLTHYAVLDIESTGIGKSADVVEIAVVRQDGRMLLDTLICPPKVAEFDGSKAQEVNHISAAEFVKAPALAKVWPKLTGLLADNRTVAFNADFDIRVLRNSAQRQGLSVPLLYATDAMKLAQAFWELDFYPSLDEAIKLAGMTRPAEQGPAHRAAADAVITARLVHRLRELSRQE